MITDIFNRTLVEVLLIPDLVNWQPPLWYGSAQDTTGTWGHQKALHEYASMTQSEWCGFFGTRMIYYEKDRKTWTYKHWLPKPANKSFHWVASSKFLRKALGYFDGENTCL